MPKTPAETREEMLSPTLNPDFAAGSTVTLSLTFERATPAVSLYDTLAKGYGENKVQAETDTVSFNGGYNLRILA